MGYRSLVIKSQGRHSLIGPTAYDRHFYKFVWVICMGIGPQITTFYSTNFMGNLYGLYTSLLVSSLMELQVCMGLYLHVYAVGTYTI